MRISILLLLAVISSCSSLPSNVSSFQKIQNAALKGDVNSQYELGVLYSNGEHGISKDDEQAVDWFMKSAEGGNVMAQMQIAVAYANGIGIAEDQEQSKYWYKKAAEQGNAIAQNALGRLYEADKQYSQAAKWYGKAAAQGNAEAQYNIAMLYLEGKGIAKDKQRAIEFLKRAEWQGHQESIIELQKIRFGSPVCETLDQIVMLPSSTPLKDCIYINQDDFSYVVLQTTPTGLIVRNKLHYALDGKVIFIYKTKVFGADIVDGASIPKGYYRYVGVYSYRSLVGDRAIYSFVPVE